MRTFLGVALALVLGACATASTGGQSAQQQPASVAQLLQGVDIPFESFTLDNGLTVLVHEDHKAPIVAVAAWFNVGSKDEPTGQTGFAHLYEHIMILNGTEHVPNLIEPLQELGASNWNGTTWYDRTNYFETVPTQALDRTLYIESERMGYLLGALTQERLDTQRGVVQNEKRQGDNQPYGLVSYHQADALFPESHPYHHDTIGSMADLDNASLEQVRQWFRTNYGPNNAVLVLAGDITPAQARTMVQHYFGAIPRGPVHTPAAADVPTLAHPVSEVMHDRVPNTRLYRDWIVPGLADHDQVALDIAAQVLGGLRSSRLDSALVRGDQTAIQVTAGVQAHQRVSFFEVTVDVKPGVDPAAVSQHLDQIISDFIANGPTADEVQRVATSQVFGTLFSVEQVGGFGGQTVALANGAVLAGDPHFFRRNLMEYGSTTPADVRAAMQHWLTRPVYSLRVDPGEREPYVEAQANNHPAADHTPPTATPREPMPAVGQIADLQFPHVERARLSNGIEVVYAQRTAIPVTLLALDFDAGVAADPQGGFGTQVLTLQTMTAGANGRNADQIAEQQERLGATINTVGSLDRSTVYLNALSANLGLSLDLFSDVVIRPDFAENEVTRLRNSQLANIGVENSDPNGMARRTLPALIYGANHPYGRPTSGLGTQASVGALTRAQLVAFHDTWMRPETARFFVVSNLPLAQVTPMLEARFGGWRGATGVPAGHKDFGAPIPAARPRIVLVDRPQSPQSVIYAGAVTNVAGATDDTLTLNAANEALGGGFLSRLNTEIRERRAWSYGVGANMSLRENRSPYILNAPVQSDRTGDAIRVMMQQMNDFRSTAGVTAAERERITNGDIRQLPGAFETAGSVLGALRTNALYHRPDNYWDQVATRYRAMTAAQMDTAARAAIDPHQFVWVVVGDAAVVQPQLRGLGLDVEVVRPPQ